MGDWVEKKSSGHVFVVRGKLGNVDVDAMVVPTDGHFTVEPRWNVLWPNEPDPGPRKPDAWGIGSVGQVRLSVPPQGAPDLWFIDVAVHWNETADDVIQKIVEGLDSIVEATSGKRATHGRSRPLVAIPTLGVSGGGLGEVRGQLVQRLLTGARKSAERHGVDVVIVAFEASDHAAFQYVRRAESSWLPSDLDSEAKHLAAKARSGDLALFVGAGVSMSSGLPSWDDLTAALMEKSPGLPIESGHTLNALDLAELISLEDANFGEMSSPS